MVKKSKKIFVMLSGGVDSSLSAALLKQRRFDVSGIFMKNWDGGVECPWVQDERDARRVAAKLDIPFYVLNFEKEYRERVFEPFLKGMREGITPNPDVFCNQEIKFGVFLERALSLGADFIATGHYARLRREFPISNFQFVNKFQISNPKSRKIIYKLLRAKDQMKDQTYFLYRLNQFQLSKAIFPIGNYLKSEVRAMAKELGLPTFNKPDSQGICFVGEAPFDEFMAQYIPQKSGEILDIKGKRIGTHKGVSFYTLGQRRGLGVGGVEKPLYVAKKDMATNTLVATEERDLLLYTKLLQAREISWISGDKPKEKKFRAKVRFRHQQELQSATLSMKEKGIADVSFSHRQRAVTPGQSIIFYKGQEVLGGGIIK